MSFDKAIASGQEHRKPWRGSARFDGSCRPHGGCPWCEAGRVHKNVKRMKIELDDDLEDLFDRYFAYDSDWDCQCGCLEEFNVHEGKGWHWQIIWEVGS